MRTITTTPESTTSGASTHASAARSSARTAARPSSSRDAARPRSLRWPMLALNLPLAIINVVGAPYYMLPMPERVRSDLHPWLRPSGFIGQSAGILAVGIFVFLWLYPLRKKFRWLAFTGAIGRWMDVHIVAAISLPLLLAIHASWRFGGVIGLGFDAMMVVCASGIIGRYLYVRIPRAKSGVELTRDEVQGQRQSLIGEIAARSGMTPDAVERTLALEDQATEGLGIGRALRMMLLQDVARWRMTRRLRARWKTQAPNGRPISADALRDIVRLVQREMALEQQMRMLAVTHRLFHYWHVFHRPVAMTALVAVVIHVAVVVALGSTWFW